MIFKDEKTSQVFRFPVPKDKRIRRAPNLLLAIEHKIGDDGKPSFELFRDKDEIIVQINSGKIDVISDFPSERWWYSLVEEKHGLPVGEKTGPSMGSGYLWRNLGAYVGLPIRGKDLPEQGGPMVNSEEPPSNELGLLAVKASELKKFGSI